MTSRETDETQARDYGVSKGGRDAKSAMMNEEPVRPQSADTARSESASTGESLEAIAGDIEAFLQEQLSRIEGRLSELISSEPPVVVNPEEDLAAAIARFRHEQELWDADRHAEAERLREESDLLKEAWQNLEVEKRQLMAERELARRGVRVPRVNHEDSVAGREAFTGAASIPDAPGGDDQSAWLQFQHMRREIQSHMQPRT